MTSCHQIENINKKKEIIKEKSMEILDLKSTIKILNSLDWSSTLFELAEEKINRLEERLIQIMRSKEQREKRMKKY